ncbi:monocarboxylate transporter, putative, partial [Ixodes scapularis]
SNKLTFCTGIFLAVLQHRITLFQIFFVGGVLLWTGILASAFVSNMTCMTITFGIIHGLGYGLSMMTLSVLLNMYFDRYRALTSGIYYSGMSCSGLAFPKFLAYLQDKYGFRGTLLIYGGIITHVTAFGLLLKEPPCR